MTVAAYGTRPGGGRRRNGKCTTLLLVLCLGAQACAARTWSGGAGMDPGAGWSQLQAVAGDTELEIQVRGAAAPPDAEVIRGRFMAATAATLTVAGAGGSERTLERERVLRVRARRPFLTRMPGWLALGALAGLMIAIFPAGGDLSFPILWMYVAPPGSIPFFLASAWKTIYNAPADAGGSRAGTVQPSR